LHGENCTTLQGENPGFEIHCNVLASGQIDSRGFKLICEAYSEDEQASWINAILCNLPAPSLDSGPTASSGSGEKGGGGGGGGGGSGGDAADLTPHQMIKEGVLAKRAIGKSMLGRKNWKDRYFRLSQARLEYFASKGATEPKGGVDISAIESVEAEGEKQLAIKFSAVHEDGTMKTHALMCRAFTAIDRNTWLAALTKLLNPTAPV
jgi:hypothetical protein